MARLHKPVFPIQPFVANRTIFRPPFRARRCCALLGGVCGGRYAEYARTLQTPVLVGHSGVLKSFFCAAPWAPGVYPRSGMGWEYLCEGTADRSGLIPSAGPAVRRNGNTALTALVKAVVNDDRAIVAALLGARADVDTKGFMGCAFAGGAVRRVGRWRPMVMQMRPCPPRPAGGQRCTGRRATASSAPPRSCSSAAPISASRQTAGTAEPPHKPRRRTATRSMQANASPIRTRKLQARRVRRGGGTGAAAASVPPYCALLPHARRAPPPASSRTPRMHSRGAACRGRVLRRTPTYPRHGLRIALRAICRCCRTAEGLARTFRIAAHSARGRSARFTHGHVARDAPAHVCNGVAGRTALTSEGRGASAPSALSCQRSNPRHARCGRSTHRTHVCIRLTPLQFDCRAFAADADSA